MYIEVIHLRDYGHDKLLENFFLDKASEPELMEHLKGWDCGEEIETFEELPKYMNDREYTEGVYTMVYNNGLGHVTLFRLEEKELEHG